jgi:hypothetical protein
MATKLTKVPVGVLEVLLADASAWGLRICVDADRGIRRRLPHPGPSGRARLGQPLGENRPACRTPPTAPLCPHGSGSASRGDGRDT